MDQLFDQYAKNLVFLATCMTCNFVDARTTSKDHVRAISKQYSELKTPRRTLGGFLVSTCLRHELYCCNRTQLHSEQYFFASGAVCIRRLLLILAGLQSEIVGEQEILAQVTRSIKDARRDNFLDEEVFSNLQALLLLSRHIRKLAEINSNENYSTIGADIVTEHLAIKADAVVAILGGGYMAQKFFGSLLQGKQAKIKKIIWINRTTRKVIKSLGELLDLLEVEIEVLNLEEGRHALNEADVIFCALANSPSHYSGIEQKSGTFVVDVSYPPIFKEIRAERLVNISNTRFDHLVRYPVPKANITHATSEIDKVVGLLERIV